MNEDVLKGKWREFKGGVKETWGKLSDDDIAMLEGKSEKLVGLLQTKYGYNKEKAEDEFQRFMGRFKK